MNFFYSVVKNKYNLFHAITITLLLLPKITYADSLIINDYSKPVDFTGQYVCLLNKGDDPEYKEISYNDTSWQKVSFPSNWGDHFGNFNGICWYRIHIIFPHDSPEKSIGINLGKISDANEVFFNGVKIGSNGKMPPEQRTRYDKEQIYEIPHKLIIPGSENVLSIRVAGLFDYANGPYSGRYQIGNYHQLLNHYYLEILLNVIFVIINVLFGFYFLMFFFRLRENKENLYFALFSFGMAIYFFSRTQIKHIYDFDYYIIKKTEFIVLTLLILFFLEFVTYFFKKQRTIFHKIYYFLNLISTGLIVFSGSYVFWDKSLRYFIEPSWSLGIGTIIIILVTDMKGNRSARIMFITVLVMIVTVINDILLNRTIINTYELSNYGYLIFIISIASLLNIKFVSLHKEVKVLNHDLENKVKERTSDLNTAFHEISKTNNELLKVKNRIWAEMQLAKKIQTVLLPDNPAIVGFDIAAEMRPADEVGGDYYDIINTPNADWVLIGDVAGHGVSAGLIMMMVQTAVQTTILNNNSIQPNDLIHEINKAITHNIVKMDPDKYMTITAMKIENNNRIKFWGLHQKIIIYRKESHAIEFSSSDGVWLGFDSSVFGSEKSGNTEIYLDSGDIILLFTDGLTEAKGNDNRIYGPDRLIKTLLDSSDKSSSQIIECFFDSLQGYRIDDDITLLVMKKSF